MYARMDDPYGFTRSWYEQRKYALTLAACRRPHYSRALEIGCSEGLFTQQLAPRCTRLVAIDAARTAVERASRRLTNAPHVQVFECRVPGHLPAGPFDLVVLSEVGYFLSPGDLRSLAVEIERSLADGGELVVVHWRHRSEDLPQNGPQVHAALRERPGWSVHSTYTDPDFLLDVLVRR
jgi:SAM-dependent methyltransferase